MHDSHREPGAAFAGEGLHVGLLGGFRFRAGSRRLVLSRASQRLLALLAVQSRPLTRACVAGMLWPEVSDQQAFASLRSTLSRMDAITRQAVSATRSDVCLSEGVDVDLRNARALASRLLQPGIALSASDRSPATVSTLSCELLPGWYDDWIVLEGEAWRQLRLHALEALADRLTQDESYGAAAEAALAAVKAEPLRESARVALIRVHLAEGNGAEALAEFDRYRALLHRDLGLEPTGRLLGLVAPLRDRRTAVRLG